MSSFPSNTAQPAAALETRLSGSGMARRDATEVAREALAGLSAYTADHCDDVVVLSKAICETFGVVAGEREDILTAANLHDIGKLAVPVEILEKPGPLSADEQELMREHTAIGEQLLRSIPELEGPAQLVRHSHERWDGTGYPDGLAGNEIPLGSRIIFCADAFHAIRCDRPYRPGRPATAAMSELRRCAGSQFDPEVVEALEWTARRLRAKPTDRRLGRSNRLMALLLVLALGASGSAIARSGLLPTPTISSAEARGAPGGCASGGCPTGAAGFGLLGVPLSAYGIVSALEPHPGAQGPGGTRSHPGKGNSSHPPIHTAHVKPPKVHLPPVKPPKVHVPPVHVPSPPNPPSSKPPDPGSAGRNRANTAS